MEEQLIYIDVRDLEIQPGLNKREKYGDLEELMRGIVSEGMKQPLSGWLDNGKYFPVNGHRRQQALNLAIQKNLPLKKIPFLLKEYTEAEKLLAQITMNSGKNYEMIEEAEVIKDLIEKHEYDLKKLVKATGKNKNQIHALITLAFADDEIKDLVRWEKISASNAIKIITLHRDDKEAQLDAIREGLVEAADEGKDRVGVRHVKSLKEKSPIERIKTVINKIKVECMTDTKLNPGTAKAVEVFDKVLKGELSISKAISELKSIN